MDDTQPGTRPNNYSFRPITQLGSWAWSEQLFRCSKCSTPTSTPNEQLFAFYGAGKLRRTTKKTANGRGKRGHRHRTSPSPKSESEPDTPTGQARPSTPHRTHQVFSLFLGFYIIMFYRLWVVMGLCGYFHAFLCKVLKFL